MVSLRFDRILLTTEELAILFGEVGNLVTTGESESATRRLSGILIRISDLLDLHHGWRLRPTYFTHPFHTVGGGNLTEHGVVLENVNISSVAKFAVVRCGTEVKLALGLGQGVESRSGGGWDTSGRSRGVWGSCGGWACRDSSGGGGGGSRSGSSWRSSLSLASHVSLRSRVT